MSLSTSKESAAIRVQGRHIVSFLEFLILPLIVPLSALMAADEMQGMKYPYQADSEKIKRITENKEKIVVGMERSISQDIIGNPDVISPIFSEKTGGAGRVGERHWYIMRRLANEGSVKDKSEWVVVIDYDNAGNVTRTSEWNENGREKSPQASPPK